MKNFFKVAVLIAVVISLFTLSAYAQDKKIEWMFDPEEPYTETFVYGGELKLGDNTVSSSVEPNIFGSSEIIIDHVYCEFDVEQSGYYNIKQSMDDNIFFYYPSISQDIRDGVAYGENIFTQVNDDGYIVYLEEGDSVFGFAFIIYEWVYPDDAEFYNINIEFLAEEITDLQIDNEYLEDIILGYHIDPDTDGDDSIPAVVKIVFNNGKELEFFEWIKVEYDEDIAPGENEITLVILNFKKTFTVQIKTVDDFIKNVEIGNPDEVAVVRETFMPDQIYSPDEDVELIITLPDGTKKTEYVFWIYEIELKGNKALTVWCDYYQKDDGKWYLTVEAAGKEFLCIPCETIPASFEENCSLYWENVMENAFILIDDASFALSQAFDLFSGLNITERFECISEAFSSFGYYYSEVYKLTEMFFYHIR